MSAHRFVITDRRLFNALSGDLDLEYALIDGAIVPVHQKAAEARRGFNTSRLAVPVAGWQGRSWRWWTPWAIWRAPSCYQARGTRAKG